MYISPFLPECIVSFLFSLSLVSNAIKKTRKEVHQLLLDFLDLTHLEIREDRASLQEGKLALKPFQPAVK